MEFTSDVEILTSAKELLEQYEKNYEESKMLSELVEPDEVTKPVYFEKPEEPNYGTRPKKSILPWILLVLFAAGACGLWYYGNANGLNFLYYSIGLAAAGIALFTVLLILQRSKQTEYIQAADEMREKYSKQLAEVEKQNDILRSEYTNAVQEAFNKADEENKLRSMKLQNVTAALERYQTKYMQTFSKLIPADCCSIEQINQMIELLNAGKAKSINDAAITVRHR